MIKYFKTTDLETVDVHLFKVTPKGILHINASSPCINTVRAIPAIDTMTEVEEIDREQFFSYGMCTTDILTQLVTA